MSIAAIVAPKYGRWTVAVDGNAWKKTFGDLVMDLVISPSGRRVACVGKEDNACTIAVDGTPWNIKCDMAWAPVFSPDDQHVAAKIEKNGQFTVAVNGKPMKTQFKNLWDPMFSPDGEKILIRAIEGSGDKAVYVRQVLPVTEISG
jgi:threonine dehydrogenase-like Zn-dependent dehydrogenase